MSSDDCILFEHFVKLLHSVSRVQPRRTRSSRSTNETPKSLEIVRHWFTRVRQGYVPTPPNAGKILFRLLFPKEDVRRRYELKESTLARSLAVDVFGLSTGTGGAGRTLIEWSEYPDTFDNAKLGCLGTEVEKVLSDRHSIRQGQSPSIQRIDSLLDELASLSGYSNLGAPVLRQKRSRAAILRDLFFDLNPTEAKFLTQIILKDLRPVLYPLAETHTTRALLQYTSNAVHILTKWEVMKAWHPCMPRVYRARGTLDEAADAVESLSINSHASQGHEHFQPILGVPIEIPKSQKGVKLSHALNFFRNQNHDVWAETKYDGERMQIHIDLTQPASRQITIFSKSKRNSTLDRRGTHPIIRAALNLPPSPEDYLSYPTIRQRVNKTLPCRILRSVVLDAEMVCYSESKGDIDEFWRLRSLIESTASGVRGSRRQSIKLLSESQESRQSNLEESLDDITESLQSNASDNGDRHLKLVFFDVMLLNGSSLLDQDYITRRTQLEQLIAPIPGYVSLSFRQRISMSGGFSAPVKALAKIFSEHIAKHQEGLVLKAAKSSYNDHRLPWVKLKRDYIPGYGDTVDLVILGAGWNKDRARELRVSPETLTTFFVAALESPVPTGDVAHCVPRFQVLFGVEYGMNREQLETFNLYIKTSNSHPFSDDMPALPYVFTLPKGSGKPTFMFERPLLAELFGAGFTKDAGMRHYTLRFPRITKVWWTHERSWTEGSDLEEFQKIARLSIGHESRDEWANRTVEAMWGCDVAQGPKDPQIVLSASNEWHEKLLSLERLGDDGNEVSDMSGDRTRNASASKRKTSQTGIVMSPTKRLKLQTGRVSKQPLRAMGSMTNFLHADADVQPQQRSGIMLHSVPTTLGLLENDHQARHESEEDKDKDEVPMQCNSISPIARERTREIQENMCIIPRHVDPISLSRPSPDISQLPASMDANKELKIISLAQPTFFGSPITMISQQVPSYKDEHPSSFGGERPLARFQETSWPTKYRHTPVVQFLHDAYVWIPRDSDNTRPTDRPPALELVPQNRRIGVMEFLLIICGCRVSDTQRTTEQFTHVNKCVIFVKIGLSPKDKEGLAWLFYALESWREELNKPGSKELFVFDSNMITYDSLATFHGDVASQALWRSSRGFRG